VQMFSGTSEIQMDQVARNLRTASDALQFEHIAELSVTVDVYEAAPNLCGEKSSF
jgi:hypothetical protein